ncbi:glucose-repressible gene protein [Phialemonium atrogriseum]|uniref:Glucose-repressible gene protein n=1 Tax=Phialemonium atrogriseum TaxID=1093897 RepID=A0AAJ0FRM2_9PEZI|nr:glucose-repressible gene protein [Phialemonium atrogriseum]KAK1770295.1 glucose-repressible gene protein [Phialemonium atrogriseum]
MDTIKNTANYVSDKVQGAGHGASKEANKQTAKDSDAPVGSRIKSAGNAVSDKAKESKSDTSAEANKQAATH